MLHNTPNTPVLIKKIKLKIWKIRSEIESVLRKKIKTKKDIDIQELKNRFTKMTTSMEENSPEIQDDESTEQNPDSEDNQESSDNNTNCHIIKQLKANILEKDIINASMLLAEIYMDTIFFFLNCNLLEGQIIAIEFLVPKSFTLKAEVLYCRTYAKTSRIIGKNRLPYRAYAKLLFTEEGDRSILREFIKSIAVSQSELKVVDDKEDDDEFSELDNI